MQAGRSASALLTMLAAIACTAALLSGCFVPVGCGGPVPLRIHMVNATDAPVTLSVLVTTEDGRPLFSEDYDLPARGDATTPIIASEVGRYSATVSADSNRTQSRILHVDSCASGAYATVRSDSIELIEFAELRS